MQAVTLAGDIGGTKTHLALFDQKDERNWIVSAKFKSANYENLGEIVAEFFKSQKGIVLKRACFGIAGPISDQKCKATNLPWIIDAEILKKELKCPVFLINDLEANAYGIRTLQEEEFFVLNEGREQPGNQALISAGTGLGEAGLFWDGTSHHPFACEGGHCSFSPDSHIEIELLNYLRKQYEHVSFERILSGPGIYHIYKFLIEEGFETQSEQVAKAFAKEDPSKVITQMAMKSADTACERALDLFVSIYGGEAANLALKMLSLGGLYIGGGIAPKILNELSQGSFMKRFIQKGRFTSLLLSIPVKVVLNENTALLGARYYAKRHERA